MPTIRYRPIEFGTQTYISEDFLKRLRETFGIPCVLSRANREKLIEIGAPPDLVNEISTFGLVEIFDEEQFEREMKLQGPRGG